MTIKTKIPPMFGIFIVVGAIGAITIMHPLVLVALWYEFSPTTETPPLLEFMSNRLWLIFLPRQINMALFFAGIGGCFGLIFAVLTRSYLQRLKSLRFMEGELGRTIPEIIKSGESARVEFKSSIRWDIQMKSVNRSLENVIAKTVAGFCNTLGGRLVIGVADNGDVLGLEKDYSTLKHSNRDGFERAIIGIVKKKLGGDLSPLIHFSFREIDGKDVCMLSIEPAPRAVYLDESNVSNFYIRSGNSTRQLDVREAVNFAKNRWKTNK
jgi:schlafen family protein